MMAGCASAPEARRQPPATASSSLDALLRGKGIDVPEPLSSTVSDIAQQITRQRIPYSDVPNRMADCSGIFLRMAKAVKHECRQLPLDGLLARRSSTQLATWFNSQGQFWRVTKPLQQDGLIKPGRIVFFSRIKPSSRQSDRQLLQSISHMGVVMETTFHQGHVATYSMFQGRKKGYLARTYNYQKRSPSSRRHPPYGNGTQYLVGVADWCREGYCYCER